MHRFEMPLGGDPEFGLRRVVRRFLGGLSQLCLAPPSTLLPARRSARDPILRSPAAHAAAPGENSGELASRSALISSEPVGARVWSQSAVDVARTPGAVLDHRRLTRGEHAPILESAGWL